MEKERKEGKKKAKSKVIVRDTFIMGGTKTITLLEGSQAPPPRLSGTNCRKMGLYEEGKKRMYRIESSSVTEELNVQNGESSSVTEQLNV